VTDHPEGSPSPVQTDGHHDAAPEQQAAGWVPEPPPYTPPGQNPATSFVAGVAESPEVMVGVAFAGGLLAAMILKRLAR
jgi:hypothetical protein